MTPININLFDELVLCNGININFHRPKRTEPEQSEPRQIRSQPENGARNPNNLSNIQWFVFYFITPYLACG